MANQFGPVLPRGGQAATPQWPWGASTRASWVAGCLVATLMASAAPADAVPAAAPARGGYLAYVGTYTGEKSRGIYAFRFDPGKASAQPLGLVAEVRNPSFLAVDATGRHLYAVNEVADFQSGESRGGAVAAFRIDRRTGGLTPIGQASSGGAGPCHLTLDRTGRHVLVANYGGGSVASLPVREDGSLGDPTVVIRQAGSSVNPRRQREPHAHSVNLSPDNRFALVADLGTDRIMVYRFDGVTGVLTPHEPAYAMLPPGSGPRHLAYHPEGDRVYVLNELTSTVTVCRYDAVRGILAAGRTFTALPAGFQGENTGAEIVVHPGGRHVYASNRGHDSVAVFAVDGKDGLRLEGHVVIGRTPRNFAIDPAGQFLWGAAQGEDVLRVFRLAATGGLTPVGGPLEVGAPVCVRFVPLP